MVTQWNPDDPNSHLSGGFQFADGRLTVPEDGRYYVYFQIMFLQGIISQHEARVYSRKNTGNRVYYFSDRLLLTMHCEIKYGLRVTNTSGGVFHLRRGEEIYVMIANESSDVQMQRYVSHFGAFKI